MSKNISNNMSKTISNNMSTSLPYTTSQYMSEKMCKKYMNFLLKPSHPDQLFYFGIFFDTSVEKCNF
jgi:hypothetical protein